MSEEIKEIKSQFESTSNELKSALTTMQEEIKSKGAASKETNERVFKAEQGLDSVVKSAQNLETRLTELEVKSNRPSQTANAVRKSLGQCYVESETYQEVKSTTRGNSVPVEQKAISDGAGSAGALTDQMRVPTIFKNPNRPMFIRDLVNHVPTMDSAVEIMRENVFTNNAAPQAGELVTKAESDITFTLETYKVETQAHWLQASRQILADVNRLRSYIDGRLMYGLDLLFDAQLLSGDGTGQNFTGLLVDADVSTVGASAAESGTVWLEHIRKAITQCQLFEYYNINGIVLNPADWETIEVSTGSDGHFIWASVPDGAEMRLWRVPVVVTNAMPQGSFILGDWTMGATLYDREQKNVRISESNGTDFVKNAITILAEERAAFAIELPKAFCKGTLTAAA